MLLSFGLALPTLGCFLIVVPLIGEAQQEHTLSPIAERRIAAADWARCPFRHARIRFLPGPLL